ncbi:MAG: helix-turn-helix domain-containing protein, partial [Betaproteobacteria bacterium]
MSQQELKRVEVVALRRSSQIDQAEAARRLGLTVRQVRRLEAKVAAGGAAGLRSA